MTTARAELPKQYQPVAIEDRWRSFWAEQTYFRPSPEAPGDPYCIVIPPPNVTARLHMGHGLDETIQDTLIRYHRMRGDNTLWVPGTDHAGIATQHMVVEKLAREGRDRREMGREAFLEECWKYKEEQGGIIVEQLKKLGCSCDWEREAFTLDDQRARAVRVAFKRLFDKGLIYRGEYLINWDPVSLTALSDDEVDYEDDKGHLWHLRYPLEDGSGTLSVATTRPETMLGDTAVAVNPTDERWKHLIGKRVRLPLVDRLIPIIADDFVKKDFGSGCVKITPGHDPNDFLCAMRHDLPMINIMTDDAHINENGGAYAGLDRFEARQRVVADFKALGLLEKVEPHDLRIGRGYRSKAIIEPRLSKQWFVKIKPLAEVALHAVESGEVRIHPPTPWTDVYRNWMTNVRDWCISRQLWWGHRIPIWYRKDNPEVMVCFEGEGVPPEVAKEPDAWVQDPDVLDTWFSSALWPASTLGWPDDTADLRKWYPTSVLVTGPDILFFWVARMIMFGYELVGRKPFDDVYMHSMVFGKTYYKRNGQNLKVIPPLQARELEREGTLPKNVETRWEKMSKTKGNGIDPLEVIDEYGTDALRLTVAALAGIGRNIDLDWSRFESYRNFVNKVWNAARFVMMITEPLTEEDFVSPVQSPASPGPVQSPAIPGSPGAVEDRWILSQLARTIDDATRSLDTYEFDKVVGALYGFTWNSFCDWYLELIKRRVYDNSDTPAARESARAARVTAILVLEHICRLLHPVTPFATEEIWQTLRERLLGLAPGQPAPGRTPVGHAGLTDGFCAPSVCVASWPAAAPAALDLEAESQIGLLQEIVGAIRNIRGEMRVPLDAKVEVVVRHGEPGGLERCARLVDSVRPLASVGRMEVSNDAPAPGFSSTYVSGALTVLVALPPELVEQERVRLEKELAFAEKGLNALAGKLANPGFLGKAPADVVEKEREKLARLEADANALRDKLAALGQH